MSERQRGLGRGLSALLGDDAVPVVITDGTDATPGEGVRRVPIETLHPNPDQPRKVFGQSDLEELATSIRDKGVIQPILVRPRPGGEPGWQIVAGERRWRASQLARLDAVPVLVQELDDLAVFEVAIIENVQRADLDPLEEAEAYRTLMDRFGRTQDQVAGIVGKSRSHVANTLRLLQLPPVVLDHLRQGHFTAGHARAMITAPDPAALADRAHREGLNVRQVEALARRMAAGKPGGASKPKPTASNAAVSADIAALEQDLTQILGLKVSLADRGGKGQLTVTYGSLDQLDDLCRRLMG